MSRREEKAGRSRGIVREAIRAKGRYRKCPEWVDIVRGGGYNQYRDVINL